MTSPSLKLARAPGVRALAVALTLPALAACQSSRGDVTGSIYPDDYRDRHPIVLADSARTLDVFIEGSGGLVSREKRDIADFLEEHRQFGNSGLVAQVPVGTETAPATRRALATLRSAVGRLSVQPYGPADPKLASPIRLTFKRLQARVASKCGLWPQDLGVSDAEFSTSNRQYWNLGCATQANLAAQVADPVDLVRGRHETPPDTGRRMFNIGQLRLGDDPSTKWRAQSTTVRSAISE